MNHEEFEQKVMQMLLAGEGQSLKSLRSQYNQSNIKSRDFTGVGFFTDYSVEDDGLKIGHINTQIGSVYGDYNNIGAVGFLLFIRDGWIDFLEGYTMGIDEWPDSYENIHLKYVKHEI